MKFIKRYKNILLLTICLIIFFIISILSIYSSKFIVSKEYETLYMKQILWYIFSFILLFILIKIKNRRILKFALPIYIINCILLIMVLFLGDEINNARSWFSIPFIGSFQPSEFMKVSLILVLAKILEDYHFKESRNLKEEIKLIIKVLIVTLLPSILVFIEPDTGIVIFYFLIALFALFIGGLRLRWFLIFFGIIAIFTTVFFIIYFNYKELFVSIFGNSFFYRIHRILDWTNTSGMQLENSLISIGSSGLTGHGINNTPIYFPEPYTDFIFSVFTSNFGFIGACILILTIVLFDLIIINIALKSFKTINKVLIGCILVCFIYAQIQNISMTIGLLPITGIPLPFISYGGSNLLSYFIMIAIIINIELEGKKWN